MYNEAIITGADSMTVLSLLAVDIKGMCKDLSKVTFPASCIGEIAKLLQRKKITGKIAKKLCKEMQKFPTKSPEDIIREKGWNVVSTVSDLEPIVQKIIQNNPNEINRYKNGETKLLGFFIGQVMKETKGQGNPKVVKELLENILG